MSVALFDRYAVVVVVVVVVCEFVVNCDYRC